MAADEVAVAEILPIAPLGHGDGLDQRLAAFVQEPGAHIEVMRQVFVADRLDHLDGDQLVEGAAQVTVVAVQHLHPIRETSLPDQPLDEGVLLTRDGGGGDVAAVAVCRVHREAAPPRADLDYPIIRRERELSADAVELRA